MTHFRLQAQGPAVLRLQMQGPSFPKDGWPAVPTLNCVAGLSGDQPGPEVLPGPARSHLIGSPVTQEIPRIFEARCQKLISKFRYILFASQVSTENHLKLIKVKYEIN